MQSSCVSNVFKFDKHVFSFMILWMCSNMNHYVPSLKPCLQEIKIKIYANIYFSLKIINNKHLIGYVLR